MIDTASGRRRIGIVAWAIMALMTLAWLWDARASLHVLVWPALIAPFVLLLPGMLRGSRNAWLLALLAAVGYATVGMMDAIANPQSLVMASLLAGISILVFFALIPAIRTMPAPPRREEY